MINILYNIKEIYKEKYLTTKLKWDIMEVGDLVRIKNSNYAPFYVRPNVGELGIIVEIHQSGYMGIIYYVQTTDGIWRFSDYELELFNEGG